MASFITCFQTSNLRELLPSNWSGRVLSENFLLRCFFLFLVSPPALVDEVECDTLPMRWLRLSFQTQNGKLLRNKNGSPSSDDCIFIYRKHDVMDSICNIFIGYPVISVFLPPQKWIWKSESAFCFDPSRYYSANDSCFPIFFINLAHGIRYRSQMVTVLLPGPDSLNGKSGKSGCEPSWTP